MGCKRHGNVARERAQDRESVAQLAERWEQKVAQGDAGELFTRDGEHRKTHGESLTEAERNVKMTANQMTANQRQQF
jgi:hypothetical protein